MSTNAAERGLVFRVFSIRVPRLGLGFCALVTLLACLPARLWAEDVAPGEVLIRFRQTVGTQEIGAFESAERLSLLQQIHTIRVRLYALPAEVEAREAAGRYAANPIVEFAEPNFLREAALPDDPGFPIQWYLQNTGQRANGVSGPAGMDIRWWQAMALFDPHERVCVAVIDSGLAVDHPDFSYNAYYNRNELFGTMGTDDDGNGYLDDFCGYDFYAQDALPMDEFGHGTLVASIIGAEAYDGVGAVGVCPTTAILPLRVLNQFGRGGVPRFARVSDLALALEYSLNAGARIVNLSLGGANFSSTELLMLRALDAGGVLVVAAAGNGGSDMLGDNNDVVPVYPAAYDVGNIIAVAAQDRSGGLAGFSNFGPTSVHLAAPGTQMYGGDVTRKTLYEELFDGAAPGWTVGRTSEDLSGNTWCLAEGGLLDRMRGIRYAPGTDVWVCSPYISLRSVQGARLTFDASYDLADDLLWIEASADGVNWLPFSFIEGSSTDEWTTYAVDCSDFDGGAGYFRFRLRSNGSLEGAGALIDNVSVSGVSLYDTSVPRYQFLDGTSFAAPVVSGVAALVMAQRPDLSARKVRSLLLESARPLATLHGKVATGGMVNAEQALRLATSATVTDAPAITTQPVDQTALAGAWVTLSLTAPAVAPAAISWWKQGEPLFGRTGLSLNLPSLAPADTGLYTAKVTGANAITSTRTVILGLSASQKVTGSASEVGSNIFVAKVGNTFDQVLMEGMAAAIKADYAADPSQNQITRVSFIDLNDDIVQVEFSGPGTLSLVLDTWAGPALPENYNQSTRYMKGHAGIVVSGATQDTNVSVYSVGRMTAVNQALFIEGVTYSGVADIAFIAIMSQNGRFGGVRTANTVFWASKGRTGIYAPGVTFEGPVYIGDIEAYESATPTIMLGGAKGNTWITGGNMNQPNRRAVEVAGLTQLAFKPGTDSHGKPFPARPNEARYQQESEDVTAKIVLNP